MPTNLETPILNDQTLAINFFNGRLLSGEDLTTEQLANRRAHQLLGQSIGDGVVRGLEVDEAAGVSGITQPVLLVKSGLAVNRNGNELLLSTDTQIALARPPSNVTGTSLFSDCRPPQGGTYIAGAGVYLLVISPVSMAQGSAPVTGLGNVAASCNSNYRAEAVQFRLLQLNVSLADLTDEQHLRNSVAYKCFSTVGHQSLLANPLGPAAPGSSLLDQLRPDHLTDCDVPLCIVSWTATGGIRFVDRWSVRRAPGRRFSGTPFAPGVDQSVPAEALARFLQFQEQIEWMRTHTGTPQVIRATDYFRYLPPVGVIPIRSATAPFGFDYLQFFQGIPVRKWAFVEGARLETMLRDSLLFEPIDPTTNETIWLYRIRQNIQSITGGAAYQPAMVFITGHAPYYGDAHYQVNRWDYSNYL